MELAPEQGSWAKSSLNPFSNVPVAPSAALMATWSIRKKCPSIVTADGVVCNTVVVGEPCACSANIVPLNVDMKLASGRTITP